MHNEKLIKGLYDYREEHDAFTSDAICADPAPVI
jgi:hypothetical protein